MVIKARHEAAQVFPIQTVSAWFFLQCGEMSTSPTKILNSIANLWFEHYLWAFSCLKYDQKHILFGLFYDVEVKWEQATTFFKSKTQRRPQVLQSGCCRCSSIGANFCMTNMRGFYHFPTPLLPQTQIWNFPLCHCSVLLCGLGIKTSDSLVGQTSVNSTHNWILCGCCCTQNSGFVNWSHIHCLTCSWSNMSCDWFIGPHVLLYLHIILV